MEHEVTPGPAPREWLHGKYIGELLNNVFLDSTRAGVLDVVRELKARARVEALVFAGTELPLLLRDETILDLPVLDTTELPVRAIVRRLRTAA